MKEKFFNILTYLVVVLAGIALGTSVFYWHNRKAENSSLENQFTSPATSSPQVNSKANFPSNNFQDKQSGLSFNLPKNNFIIEEELEGYPVSVNLKKYILINKAGDLSYQRSGLELYLISAETDNTGNQLEFPKNRLKNSLLNGYWPDKTPPSPDAGSETDYLSTYSPVSTRYINGQGKVKEIFEQNFDDSYVIIVFEEEISPLKTEQVTDIYNSLKIEVKIDNSSTPENSSSSPLLKQSM